MSNVVDFPRRPAPQLAGEPIGTPVLCLLDPGVRVLDFTRALAAGGFTMVYNRAAGCVLIKAAVKP
ncbi:MAG: hypothetical protein ABI885_22755 [Gammaproteobacteria bacterium]